MSPGDVVWWVGDDGETVVAGTVVSVDGDQVTIDADTAEQAVVEAGLLHPTTAVGAWGPTGVPS